MVHRWPKGRGSSLLIAEASLSGILAYAAHVTDDKMSGCCHDYIKPFNMCTQQTGAQQVPPLDCSECWIEHKYPIGVTKQIVS